MELKDVILSTLAEMEDASPIKNMDETKEQQLEKKTDLVKKKPQKKETNILSKVKPDANEDFGVESEISFLNSTRERLLVLFEGFQAPNNTNIEAKIDMTLNFLEYMLANIDNRVEELKKK